MEEEEIVEDVIWKVALTVEEAYQELCERLKGELLEELKQSAQSNTTEASSGADCQ